jgi:hypothetical protein
MFLNREGKPAFGLNLEIEKPLRVPKLPGAIGGW